MAKHAPTSAKAITERTAAFAAPICEKLGLELWDTLFEKEGTTWYLRVLLERDGGVSLQDCTAFSEEFNEILDREDYIPQSYVFEAGSPGLGRNLRKPEHFEKVLGEQIRFKLFSAVNGVKEFSGTLTRFEPETFTILSADESTEMTVKLSECAFVKLYDDADLF